MKHFGLAIVGLGPWGRNLLRVFSSIERVRLAAVCDTNPERLHSALQSMGEAGRTARFSDVLGDVRVHAVVLASPPAAHADQCVAALDAGKHVFVEKPMALHVQDATRIIGRVRSSRQKLMVGHILRHHPALLRLAELISSGRLGRVLHMSSVRLGTGTAIDAEGTWWTLAPHDVSAMRALVQSEPVSIRASLGRPLPAGHRPVSATLRFSDGCSAAIAVSLGAPRKVRRITVIGSVATAVFDDLEPRDKLRLHATPAVRSSRRDLHYESVSVSSDEPLLLEARHFASAVLEGSPISTDVTEGGAVVAVLEAGYRSLCDGGRPITIAVLPEEGFPPLESRNRRQFAAVGPEVSRSAGLVSVSSDE